MYGPSSSFLFGRLMCGKAHFRRDAPAAYPFMHVVGLAVHGAALGLARCSGRGLGICTFDGCHFTLLPDA